MSAIKKIVFGYMGMTHLIKLIILKNVLKTVSKCRENFNKYT